MAGGLSVVLEQVRPHGPFVSPKERVRNRWRDSITPPVQIIGSQGRRKRKYTGEDTQTDGKEVKLFVLNRNEDAKQEAELTSDLKPWYKVLLEKINSKSEIKYDRTSALKPSCETKKRIETKLDEGKRYEHLTTLYRDYQDEKLVERVRLLADVAVKVPPPRLTTFSEAEAQSSYRETDIQDILSSQRLFEKHTERLPLDRDHAHLEREHPVLFNIQGTPYPYYDGSHRNDRYVDKEKILKETKYSPDRENIKKEREEGPYSGTNEFCKLCAEASHFEEIFSIDQSKYAITPSLLRIPAKRLLPTDTSTSSTHILSGPACNDFHTSDRSAFSIFGTNLERCISDNSHENIKHEKHTACDARSGRDCSLLQNQELTRNLYQHAFLYARDDANNYVAAPVNERLKSSNATSPERNIFYDKTAFDSYQKLVMKSQRAYGSPDSQKSEDSGFISGTKEARCKGKKVTVETQTSNRKGKGKSNDCFHLWEFLRDMLNNEGMVPKCIEWTNRETGEFRLIKTGLVAKLWGQSKNRTSMTYEKMARAMRYYYKIKILEKVPNKRLHFRFGNHMLPKVLL